MTINYPTEVTTKRAYVYFTEINLISELGGWFGLLFGFSIFDLCCFFFNFLTRNPSLKINWILNKPAILKIIIALICSSIVWWQLSVCLCKYISNPISTNIVIGKPDEKLGVSITFCYKGFGYQGPGLDTFYSEEEKNQTFIGRLDFSFIKTLDIQYTRSSIWESYWNQRSTNDLFKEFLEPYPDLLFCNSLEVPERISRLRITEANTKNLLIFVHGTGIFTIPGRRAALSQEAKAGIFVYNIGLEYSYSLSTEEHYCETDFNKYPDIRKAATMAKVNNTN